MSETLEQLARDLDEAEASLAQLRELAESGRIADYSQIMRGIPDENVIRVSLPVNGNSIGRETFERIYEQVRRSTPPTSTASAAATQGRGRAPGGRTLHTPHAAAATARRRRRMLTTSSPVVLARRMMT